MADFRIKRGDTSPILEKTLADEDGVAVNLTGASVRFHMIARGASTLTVDAAATVVTPSAGTVSYTWAPTDTAVHGCYDAEFEVTYADGSIETFPNDKHLVIQVTRDLG